MVPSSTGGRSSESSLTLIVLDYLSSGRLMSRKSTAEQVRIQHRLRFTDDVHYRRVYALMSDLAKKGATLRLRNRERLFDSPALVPLLDRAEVHRLRQGEVLQEVSLNSLFIVNEGEIKLICRLVVCNKQTKTEISHSCSGLINIAKGRGISPANDPTSDCSEAWLHCTSFISICQ